MGTRRRNVRSGKKPVTKLGPSILHDFDAATRREWLETNGMF